MNVKVFKAMTAVLLSFILLSVVNSRLMAPAALADGNTEADIGFRVVVLLDAYTVTPGPNQHITGTAKLVYYNKDFVVVPEDQWPGSGGDEGSDYNSVPASYPLTVTLTGVDHTTENKTVASGETFSFDVTSGQAGSIITIQGTGGPVGTPPSIPQEVELQ